MSIVNTDNVANRYLQTFAKLSKIFWSSYERLLYRTDSVMTSNIGAEQTPPA